MIIKIDNKQSKNLPVDIGDKITTFCGNSYIVESIEKDDDCSWIVPKGANDFTYLIPFCNIIEIEKS